MQVQPPVAAAQGGQGASLLWWAQVIASFHVFPVRVNADSFHQSPVFISAETSTYYGELLWSLTLLLACGFNPRH